MSSRLILIAILSIIGQNGALILCPNPELLPLGKLGAKCAAGSYTDLFPCNKAMDGNKNTMWHPDISHVQHNDNPYIQIDFDQDVTLVGIGLLTYEWGHGSPKKIRYIYFNILEIFKGVKLFN